MTKSSLSILIVDDEKHMADTLRDTLKVKGHQAKVAYSALEALDEVKKSSFDCVIADILMPKMDGVELCRVIKEIQPKLPVILITGYEPNKLVNEGKEAGANAVLIKPFDVRLLLKLLSNL
jgi:CheY-like chemotaxis protein